jgi:hypothetical protein
MRGTAAAPMERYTPTAAYESSTVPSGMPCSVVVGAGGFG